MTTAYVGHPVPRLDAPEKVTGRAVYGVDLKLPGMLHAKILRSPVPHARIARLDTTRAERLVGVRAVVTGRDTPYTHNAAIIKDWPFLAQDKVRHVGEAVAAVAAVDEETAEEALGLIDVDYDELPAVFDPEAAMQPGAPLLHERLMEYPRAEAFHPVAGTNICNHYRLRRGDAEAALAGCHDRVSFSPRSWPGSAAAVRRESAGAVPPGAAGAGRRGCPGAAPAPAPDGPARPSPPW